jgi:DNA-binding transcriptional LysR family regulator
MVKPYLEQVYGQAHAAKRQALDFVKLRKTVLKLGVMCTIAPDQLVDLVCAVQSRNPGIELEIMDSSAEKLEERLIEGELEVAIHCPAANQKDERLHYMPLYREQFLVVLPAEHPLAAKNGIRPGDLNGLRYLNRINCEFNGYAGALWKERAHLRDGVSQRTRRLDPGHGRERPRLRLHAGKLGQTPAGDRPADDRSRVLA